MRRDTLTCCVVMLLIGLASCELKAEPVTVFAAASLTTSLEELATRAPEGLELRLAFGSSSTMARQIEEGAPADVFVSASPAWMDYLFERSLLEPGTRVDLLGNSLVVIAPRGDSVFVDVRKGFDFAASFEGRLALGDPSYVPAGIYARQALEWLGWWDGVKGRLAPASDVRGALTFVARGECEAGIVYATDAAITPDVVVTAVLPAESHEPIIYPAAVVKGRMSAAVRGVMAFLESEDARCVFEEAGFRVK